MEASQFDPEQHERDLAEKYARLAKYDAFNRFIDMALDGVISQEEAIQQFREEYVETA